MRNIRTWFHCTVLVGTFVTAAPVLADLSARYQVVGRDIAGHDFSGAITFAASGQIYKTEYQDAVHGVTSGVAIEYENYLGVALRAPDGAGWLALYQRSGTGWAGVITHYNRDDLFALAMYNGQAPALLNPKQTTSVQVSGKYAISGTNPDGSTYSGQVQIISSSGIIDIIRNPGTEEMTGSGTVIVVNGTLAIN